MSVVFIILIVLNSTIRIYAVFFLGEGIFQPINVSCLLWSNISGSLPVVCKSGHQHTVIPVTRHDLWKLQISSVNFVLITNPNVSDIKPQLQPKLNSYDMIRRNIYETSALKQQVHEQRTKFKKFSKEILTSSLLQEYPNPRFLVLSATSFLLTLFRDTLTHHLNGQWARKVHLLLSPKST